MKAVLKRYALKVEMVLNAEELFPRLRRCITGRQEVYPNRTPNLWKRFQYEVWGGERCDSAENIHQALHPVAVRDCLA